MKRETELAWVAGLFDGEGSFCAKRVLYKPTGRWSYSLTVSISQKDPEVLHKVTKILGYGKVYLCGGRIHQYYVSKRATVEKFIQEVGPFLSNPKHRQLALAQERLLKWKKEETNDTVCCGRQGVDGVRP